MTMRKKTVIALTILFVFVMFFSHVFVIEEADHDCSGEDCPICEIIAIVSDTIKGLSLIGAVIVICAASVFGILKSLHIEDKTQFVSSLITLKVKLLN